MLPLRGWRQSALFAYLYFCPRTLAHRFSYPTCCEYGNDARILWRANASTPDYGPLVGDYLTCNQEFNATLPPAESVYVRYQDCKYACSGFALSNASDPDAWAGAVVQFILPSLIFSMSIPRRRMFLPSWTLRVRSGVLNRKNLSWPVAAMLIPIIALGEIANTAVLWSLTALDTVIWVAVILALAGPLMVSGLKEALLDFKVLNAISRDDARNGPDSKELNDPWRLKLIVAVVCGNMLLPGDELLSGGAGYTNANPSADPVTEIPKALMRQSPENIKSQLLYLMSAQGAFGALVGAPVVFYLGGFIYTLLDLLSDPSEQDAAISLAFGVEWMIIVHVAIVSGCLLASNNPSAVSVLAGKPPSNPNNRWRPLVYETRYQPVSMLQRGSNKQKWLKALKSARCTGATTAALQVLDQSAHIGWKTYISLITFPTIVLISLPSAAGAVVAWKTPPVGWGCRSLTLVCYAGCQLLVILLKEAKDRIPRTPRQSLWSTNTLGDMATWWRSQYEGGLHDWTYRLVRRLYILMCLLSLFTALGGTIMQLMGVYKNCFCYVNAGMWLNLENAYVEVASDTSEQRNASTNWVWMGGVATVFMGLCSLAGWWYGKKIRDKYKRIVNRLQLTESQLTEWRELNGVQ